MVDLMIKTIKKVIPNFLKEIMRKQFYLIKFRSLKINSNVKLGPRNYFENGVTLNDNVSISNTKIGSFTYISSRSHFNNTHIGKFCSIGPEVICGLGIHPTQFVSTHPSFFSLRGQSQVIFSAENYIEETKITRIGNDVWIGARVTILDGVSIGDGAIIGAGSVVTKDIPPYSIVVGSPAKVKSYRFDEKTIQKLINLKWWNWDMDKLYAKKDEFIDVKKFLSDLDLDDKESYT